MIGYRGGVGLGSVALFASLLASLAPVSAGAEEISRKGEVRIGVVGSVFRDVPEPRVQLMLLPLKALMEKQTGMTPRVVTGFEAETLGRQLMEKKVQLGVFHGVEFGWARGKHPDLKPLMIAVPPERQFRAYLVVHSDSTAKGIADLKDKTVAIPRRSREHCHIFLQRRCQECGQTVQNFFAKINTPPDSEETLDSVIDGKADAAVVDRLALDSYQDRKPGRFKRLKTAQESEVFPPGVIVYCPGALDEETLERFRTGMLKANQTKEGKHLLTLCQIVGFEQVPADYDQMLEGIVKAYPPPDRPAKEEKEKQP